MLYHLLFPLGSEWILFNVFKYITFRSIMATLTALMISFLLGKPLVYYLRAFQIGQTVRDDGPQSHLSKSGTPHDFLRRNRFFRRLPKNNQKESQRPFRERQTRSATNYRHDCGPYTFLRSALQDHFSCSVL